MERVLSEVQGKLLIKVARQSIASFFEGDRREQYDGNEDPILDQKGMGFVTIEERGELRGCIGYLDHEMALRKTIWLAARSAAFHDPRFPPLRKWELPNILIEVSLLIPPCRIEVEDKRTIPEKIKVGRDGLIVKRGIYSGLLLPQVAVEYSWDSKTFLEYTCMKAGLRPDCWLEEKTEVFRFEGLTIKERNQEGDIEIKYFG